MKKLLLLCLTTLFALTTWAQSPYSVDFVDNGIYYHILDETSVAVTDSAYQRATSTYVGDLVIPESVEYEGSPYTVTAIGDAAFAYCPNLETVTFPETITSIGTYVFWNCASLKDIVIPDGFTAIPIGMFYQCVSLTNVTLPESIETISEQAFQECTNLEEVTIGSKVTYIGYWAFAYCDNLTNFYSLNPEPPECELLDFMGMGILISEVFDGTPVANCTLHVPVGSTEKYESADQWSAFGYIIEIDETITPPTVETLAVTDITNSTATLHGTVSAGSEEILETGFQYWVNVNATQTIVATSVSDDEISSTIQRLSSATEYTFRAYATTATETTYGERMTFTTTDYDFAEENSEGQTIYYKILSSSSRTCMVQYLYYASADNGVAYEGELTIPETVTHDGTTYRVTTINEYAFYECRNLTKVVIPTNITDIGPYSFQNCTSLEEATFPNTISTIWDYTFDGCTSLKEAIIPSSVTRLRQYAFRGCSSITELTFPNTVKTIESGIFQNCTGLKKVTLEEGVTNTGYAFMFDGCTSLVDISLPSTLTEMGTYSFSRCTSLKSFTYPDSMTYTGTGCLTYCASLEEVTFSKNTTTISNFTFSYCDSLEKIAFPEGTKTLGYQLFMYSYNLKEVSLPKTVEEIGFHAFLNCSSMEKLYCLNPTPPALQDLYPYGWFDGINEDCVLYVPTGSRETYSTTDVWKDFFNTIIEVATVETLSAEDITATSAVLNGAVTAGDTPITQKGFEFWKNGSENVLTTIYVEDDDLTFSITNLDPETNYTYRAFAVTVDGTFYGEDVEFTTAEDISDGIDSVGMDVANSENIEGIYSTSGQKLNTTVKGVNIIRYTDGTTKKVLVK